MPRYKVMVDKGWPLGAAVYKFGEQFDSDDPRIADDVEHGYLEVVTAGGMDAEPLHDVPPDDTTTDRDEE